MLQKLPAVPPPDQVKQVEAAFCQSNSLCGYLILNYVTAGLRFTVCASQLTAGPVLPALI